MRALVQYLGDVAVPECLRAGTIHELAQNNFHLVFRMTGRYHARSASVIDVLLRAVICQLSTTQHDR